MTGPITLPDPRFREAERLYQSALSAQAAGRYLDALHPLNEAAKLGHLAAMTQLGGQLLTGRGAPPDVGAGVRMITIAASRGGAYACGVAAMILASGLIGVPDWPAALEQLQRSAELGYPPASEQLLLLGGVAGVSGDPADGKTWARLRQAIDLGWWRSPPAARSESEDPLIRVIERFAPAPICDWLIERARPALKPALVFNLSTGGAARQSARTNSAAAFSLLDVNLPGLLVRERLAAAVGTVAINLEAPQVLHYAVGQAFHPHVDFLDPGVPATAANVAQRGQRSWTTLVYLNEGFEGGETDFPTLGLRFLGGKGDALLFRNVDAEGRIDGRTMHAGLPPTAGEKWLLSQWVRDRQPTPFTDPFARPGP